MGCVCVVTQPVNDSLLLWEGNEDGLVAEGAEELFRFKINLTISTH